MLQQQLHHPARTHRALSRGGSRSRRQMTSPRPRRSYYPVYESQMQLRPEQSVEPSCVCPSSTCDFVTDKTTCRRFSLMSTTSTRDRDSVVSPPKIDGYLVGFRRTVNPATSDGMVVLRPFRRTRRTGIDRPGVVAAKPRRTRGVPGARRSRSPSPTAVGTRPCCGPASIGIVVACGSAAWRWLRPRSDLTTCRREAMGGVLESRIRVQRRSVRCRRPDRRRH